MVTVKIPRQAPVPNNFEKSPQESFKPTPLFGNLSSGMA